MTAGPGDQSGERARKRRYERPEQIAGTEKCARTGRERSRTDRTRALTDTDRGFESRSDGGSAHSLATLHVVSAGAAALADSLCEAPAQRCAPGAL